MHCLCVQVSAARKAEVQAQKREEKAAKEQAKLEKDMRSYKHIMQVVLLGRRLWLFAHCLRTGRKYDVSQGHVRQIHQRAGL